MGVSHFESMHTAIATKMVPPTVLIVDDHVVLRARLREDFLSHGFTVCPEAGDGKQAIEVARECKPDIIVLDLSMPVMNGLEAAPILKQILPDTPIILFTLHRDAFENSNLSCLGITAILSKSAPLDKLLQKVDELLNKQSEPK